MTARAVQVSRPPDDVLKAGGLTRRAMLGLGMAGGAAALVGCQVDTGSGETEGSSVEIEIPDLGGDLPTEDVTFRWVDSGDLKSVFVEAVLEAFTEKHPNITTQYDGSGWDTVNQVVPLGIRNGSAHDVFAKPQEVPTGTMISEGWVQPVQDLIPDFDAWLADWPDGAFIPGIHVFDGKLYSCPLSSNRRLDFMTFYDEANVKAAGVDDPVAMVQTWDDLRALLEQMSKADQPGLALAGKIVHQYIKFLAKSGGWLGNFGGELGFEGINPLTGEYHYAADEMMDAYDFLNGLVQDKLVVPGFLTVGSADARAQMTAGNSGMIFNGPWDIPAWKKTAPDWKYQVGPVPGPQGLDYTLGFPLRGVNDVWVYAETELSEVAGQIYHYMGSKEGQKQLVILSEGNLLSLMDDVNEQVFAEHADLLDENAKRVADLAQQYMRALPQVEIRNPDVDKVKLELKPVQPLIQDIMEGAFSGQIDDVKAALVQLDSDSNQALDDAIAAANNKGASVTRDDYVFANWDPAKDYTAADYEELS